MKNEAAIRAGLEAILQLMKDDEPAVPVKVFVGPNLAGFLAARSKVPADGTYPSMMTYALAQRDDMTNGLTPAERQTITGQAWRIGSAYVGALPVTMPYAEVLYRYLHPEAYNPRTGQPQTEADRLQAEADAAAWNKHWEEKAKATATPPAASGTVDVPIG